MMRRSLFFLSALGLAIAHIPLAAAEPVANEPVANEPVANEPATNEPRGNDPFSPADSLKQIVLSPALGLRADLVAQEPQVIDPVAIAFDEQGRMYVVEMRDYPHGPGEGHPPLSRIRLLEDTDGNGQFETAHLFADELLFATGVLPWKGGVIATLAGEVRYLKDTDGDHQADVNELWFQGFATENPQLRANHPTLGPDGWIYIANGLRGGNVTTVHPDWPKQTLDLRDGDFRFNPRTGQADVVAGGGQFGLTFDAWGHRFICSNRNPCDQVMLEHAELERNPALAVGKPVQVVCAAGNDSRVFSLADAWTTSTLHAGQFTAACGVKIFTGDALPAECVGNVFTCEPTGSLMHREVLKPAGSTFAGTPGAQGVEFLASTDSWFRPVNVATGPDGALYVVDMYRAVIEHPQWMPEELRNRRDLRWGDEMGRIYRVAAQKNPPARQPAVDPENVEELFAALENPNGWIRDTAGRLLLEQPERLKIAPLLRTAKSAKLPEARLRAIQLAINAPEGDPEEIVLIGLNDADPRVVAGSVVQAGRLLRNQKNDSDAIRNKILELASSGDAAVRFEVARQIGVIEIPLNSQLSTLNSVTHALATVASRDANDRWTRAAVLTSLGDPLALYDATVKMNSDGAVPFLVELAEVIGRRKKPEETAALLERLSTTGPESGWATPILLGLGRGMGGSLESALKTIEPRARRRFDALFGWAAGVAGDAEAPVEQRQSLVALIGLGERSHSLPVLLDLMDNLDNAAVRVAVAQALGRFRGDERIAAALLEGFGSRPPAVRSAVLDAVLADPNRAMALLEAVENEMVSVAELGPTRIAALSKHKDKAVRDLASKLFAPPADRQAVLSKYQSAATMNGDSNAGRALFEKNCATCHRIGELGIQVGPDIADSRTRTPAALLTDILDPNRAIDGRYMAFSVLLTDGTVQTGIITSETGGSVTLAQPEGKTLTLSRDQIEELNSDGISLMPVGIERTISPEQMADLISFIKNWRYLDGAVPLGEASP